MSTIVDFRRWREETALARLASAPAETASAPMPNAPRGENTAEIILFPRKERTPRKPRRKALKRRFTLRATARAMP